MRINGNVYFPRLKGRAWIAGDNYQVLGLQTDLINPIPEIDLQVEHLDTAYAPVDFRNSSCSSGCRNRPLSTLATTATDTKESTALAHSDSSM